MPARSQGAAVSAVVGRNIAASVVSNGAPNASARTELPHARTDSPDFLSSKPADVRVMTAQVVKPAQTAMET